MAIDASILFILVVKEAAYRKKILKNKNALTLARLRRSLRVVTGKNSGGAKLAGGEGGGRRGMGRWALDQSSWRGSIALYYMSLYLGGEI